MLKNKSIVDENRISVRATLIEESVTLAIAEEAKQMKKNGLDVISLSTGEPDFPTPKVIKEAAINAIEENFTKYTNANGIIELRKALAEKLKLKNNINASEHNILVSAGGKQALMNALLATLNKDDEVIIPAPYWTSYPEMVRITEARPVVINTDVKSNFKITPQDIYNYANSRTKGIIINSPSNPTGVIYTEAELRDIARVIAELGIYVYSDELYEDIIFGNNKHFSIGSIKEIEDYAISVYGFSKSYAMTGWRMGYLHAPEDVLKAAAKIQSQTTSHPSSISQKAALSAAVSASSEVEQMRKSYEVRMKIALDELDKIPNIYFPTPNAAFYFFFDISKYFSANFPNSFAVSDYLLKKKLVAVVPGGAFGNDNCIRVSYACCENDIIMGINRIAEGLSEINNFR